MEKVTNMATTEEMFRRKETFKVRSHQFPLKWYLCVCGGGGWGEERPGRKLTFGKPIVLSK